jgi:pimeloyl-ACP methyl ester carboxylesterase
MTSVYEAPLAGDSVTITTEDGTRLHAMSRGSGVPIVLAHGFAVDSDEWNVIGDDLVGRGFRVIAFDQRGHSRSTIGSDGVGSRQMAGDYAAVLDHFDARGAVLVAHSMGGFLAIRFLVENPGIVRDRIKALLLVATFAGDVNRRNPQNKAQIPLIRSGLLARAVRADVLGIPFARTLIGESKDLGMARAFLASFRQQDLVALAPILEAMVAESRYDRLGEIDLPCTIAIGTKDKTTPPFHTDDLHRGIRGSKLVRYPGLGHMLNWEASGQLADEIAALAAT